MLEKYIFFWFFLLLFFILVIKINCDKRLLLMKYYKIMFFERLVGFIKYLKVFIY